MSRPSAVSLKAIEYELLRLLLLAPLQSAEDLARWLNLHPNQVWRHLAILAQLDLVADLRLGCLGRNRGRTVYLTPRGIALLADDAAMPPRQFAHRWGVDLPGIARHLVRFPAHTALQAHLAEILEAHVYAMQQQFAPRDAAFTWYWVRDYAATFRAGPMWARVWTDGLIVLQPQMRHPQRSGFPATVCLTYACWLMLDPGTGDAPLFLDRLVALLHLRDHRRTREGIDAFPPVLIFSPSPYRASMWRLAADSAARKEQTSPLTGMIQIAPPARYADWWPPGQGDDMSSGTSGTAEWNDLVNGERCALPQVFREPLPMEALPPAIIPFPFTRTSAALAGTHTVLPPATYTRDLGERLDHAWRRSSSSATTLTRLGQLMLTLTRRHLDVLGIVAAHPVIPLAELSTILDITGATCRVHYLRGLTEQGLLTQVAIPCNLLNRQVPTPDGYIDAEEVLGYHLTSVGLALLANLQHLPPHHLPSTHETHRCIAQAGMRGQHNVGVYRFFALLIAAAREQPDRHRLLWWQTGSTCTRRFIIGTNPDGTPIAKSICPDAIGEYAWGNRRLRFWLEWDMGSMNTRQLLAKFLQYARYMQSQALYEEAARSLPILYVVTPDVVQESRIARILAALIAERHLDPRGHLSVRTTTFALLAAEGPLARIWRSQLPHPHTLASHAGSTSDPPIAMLDAVRPLLGGT